MSGAYLSMGSPGKPPQRKIRGTHNTRAWARKVASFHWRCYYCGNALRMRFESYNLEPEHELTKDHLVPLCRGGEDVLENLVPACLRCNRMKSRMTAAEFLANRKFAHLQTDKPGKSTGIYFDSASPVFALELTDEPTLLDKVIYERERVSWAWRNPA